MKPRFALDLSPDGLRLLERDGPQWQVLGTAALEAPDFQTQLRALRRRARDAAEQAGDAGLACKLVIPSSQILYLELEAPGRDDPVDALRGRIEAALDGRTPYAVADLVYDWSVDGTRLLVAVVARETLTEAEDFARHYGFCPVSFVAQPAPDSFEGEPWFGMTRHAADFLPAGVNLEPDWEAIELSDPPESDANDLEMDVAAEAAPEAQDQSAPDVAPSADQPDAPEPDLPSPDLPEPVPEDPIPTEPAPDLPGPDLPAPQDPAPETPGPDLPAEPTPDPARPDPEAPDPALPSPDLPSPELPPQEDPAPASEPELPDPGPDLPELVPGGAIIAQAQSTAPEPLAAEDGAAQDEDTPEPRPAPTKAAMIFAAARRAGAPRFEEPIHQAEAGPTPKGETLMSGWGGITAPAIDLPIDTLDLRAHGLTQQDAPAAPAPIVTKPAPTSETGSVGTGATPGATILAALAKARTARSAVAEANLDTTSDATAEPSQPATEKPTAPVPPAAPLRATERRLDPEAPPAKGALLGGERRSQTPARPARAPSAARQRLAQLRPSPRQLAAGAVAAVVLALGTAALWSGIRPAASPEISAQAEALAPTANALSAEAASQAPAQATELAQETPTEAKAEAEPLRLAALETRTLKGDRPGQGGLASDAQPDDGPDSPLLIAQSASGIPPVRPLPPPPYNQLARRGADGTITPTPEGVEMPGHFRLFSGKPPVVPRPRPDSVSAAAIAAKAPAAPPATKAEAAPQATPDPLPATNSTAAAEPAQDPALAGHRPKARPETVSAAAAPPPADPALAGIQPQPRPQSLLQDGAPAASEASTAPQASDFIDPTELAVTVSRRPGDRPRNFDGAIRAAIADSALAPVATPSPVPAPAPPVTVAAPIPTPSVQSASKAQEDLDEPEPVAPAPKLPTSASVAKRATETNALRLKQDNLIGVYGATRDRKALVRTANGRILRLSVGDRFDGGEVIAIGNDSLTYRKGTRSVKLALLSN